MMQPCLHCRSVLRPVVLLLLLLTLSVVTHALWPLLLGHAVGPSPS